MSRVSLARAAAEYVRNHRVERQGLCLYSDRPVELTTIYNQWAVRAGVPFRTITDAPGLVLAALETTRAGHDLFGRVRDGSVIVYRLREGAVV